MKKSKKSNAIVQNRIKALRESKGLSREELARYLDITIEHLINLEDQIESINTEIAVRVCIFFKISILDLVY